MLLPIAAIFVSFGGQLYQQAVARNEFFGNNDNYKCHCRGLCQTGGQCANNDDCMPPYFGFLCQYINIVSEAVGGRTKVTDGNHATCNELEVYSMTFRFSFSIRYSFLLLVLKAEPFVSLGYKRHNFTLTFRHHSNEAVKCLYQEIWEVAQDRSRVECWHQVIIFDEIVLTGHGVGYICEVYLSYGRNVGLKQRTHTILPHYHANSAVDGEYKRCSQLNPRNQLLTVTIPRNVYTIYNIRIYQEVESHGFTLVIDEPSGSNMVGSFTGQIKHSVPNNITYLIGVSLKKHEKENYLTTLCELELYGDCIKGKRILDCFTNCTCGDSRCDDSGNCYLCDMEDKHYNVCRQSCQNCLNANDFNNNCMKEGFCPSCESGYKGKQCTMLCKNCGGSGKCDQEDGRCTEGCSPGYRGELCGETCGKCGGSGGCNRITGDCDTKPCKPGYRGSHCNFRCSHCSGDGSCDWNTSSCIHGCQTGFRGDVCLLSCSKCAGNGSCGRNDSTCHHGCIDGYRGSDCSDACTNCAGNGSCNRNTSQCHSGCLHGFKGKRCSLRCQHCVNESCVPEDGTCKLGCIKGYYGSVCETACGQCAGDGGCNNITGECDFGCAKGFYKPKCNEVCGNCADEKCDFRSGKCEPCKAGYTGDLCKEAISEPTSTGSVVVFYVTFLVIIGIVMFFLFCSQNIYTCFTLTTRESLDSSYKRKLRKSGSTYTVKSDTEASQSVYSRDSRDNTLM